MRYSLITLSHNKLPITQRCLSNLLLESYFDGEAEMIVVDNGSRDGSAEWLRDALPAIGASRSIAVKTIMNDCNIGCSTARNQALALATGEYIAFCDNDVEPRTRAWLTLLRQRIESAPDIAMAGAKMIYPHPPHAIQCAGVAISKRGRVCFRGRGEERGNKTFNTPEEVQCLISAALLVRHDLIRRHGGFDEVFNPVQFEDFDLCYRIREQGWQAWYEPAAEMYHFESVTTQGTPTLVNAAVVARNGLLFQKRWRHLFENEDGPPDAACRWLKLPQPPTQPPLALPRE